MFDAAFESVIANISDVWDTLYLPKYLYYAIVT